MRKGRTAVAALLLVLTGIAMFTVSPAVAENATVNITDSGLSPSSVTIAGGESVTWLNKTDHEVALTSNDFDGQRFSGEYTNRFDQRGDYSYTVNPGNLQGLVHVTSDAPTTAPPPTSPPATQPSPNTTERPGAVVRTTVAKAVPTTPGGIVPSTTALTLATTTSSTSTTTPGPPPTGGEFAIGRAGSNHRGAIIAIVAAAVAVAAAGGYLAYRRRLRTPY